MSMYGYVLVCMGMYGYIYNYVLLCVDMHGYILVPPHSLHPGGHIDGKARGG